jgi:hypothetical protein
MDYIKRFMFYIFIWIVLTVVFFTGTAKIDLFSVGYIAGSFTFFWQGQDFYTKPLKSIVTRWTMLIFYNALVVFLKLNMTFWTCLIYEASPMWYCGLLRAMKVGCFKFMSDSPSNMPESCLPGKEPILIWDCIAFCLLIIQKRMFYSEYFTHVTIDGKASALLASRGADLIEELFNKYIVDEAEKERELLEEVKGKMERIKKTKWMKSRDSKLMSHSQGKH